MSKMTKIRASAKGEMCTVRIPNICNHNPETVVLAHLNGGGMGMKNPDYQGAYCCSACHDVIDHRKYYKPPFIEEGRAAHTLDFIRICHLEGVIRTQEILRKKGLIEVKE